jgi:hypothetical protein
MTQKILYLENDKVAIMSPGVGVSIESAVANVPAGQSYVVVDDSQLPNTADLYQFFDALTVNFSTKEISFNLEAAREIVKSNLRKRRIKFFEKNDVALLSALIDSDQEKLDIAITERNRLRDITTLVDIARSIEELKSITL